MPKSRLRLPTGKLIQTAASRNPHSTSVYDVAPDDDDFETSGEDTETTDDDSEQKVSAPPATIELKAVRPKSTKAGGHLRSSSSGHSHRHSRNVTAGASSLITMKRRKAPIVKRRRLCCHATPTTINIRIQNASPMRYLQVLYP